MGQSKGSQYEQIPTLSPQQQSLLDQILGQSGNYTQQAASGYSQFLPGGGGGQAFIDQAMKNYQQQTIPSILNAYGSGSKGSSALNQALASSASNLNTDLAAMLAKAQLEAAGGLGRLGLGGQQLGLGTQPFALTPKQQPFWQQLLLSSIAGGSELGKSALTKAPMFMM